MIVYTPQNVRRFRELIHVSPLLLVQQIDEGFATACTPAFEHLLRVWALQENMTYCSESAVLNYKVPDGQDP